MRFVTVDIGNSRIKLKAPGQKRAQIARVDQPLEFKLPSQEIAWFVSSVNPSLRDRLAEWVLQNRPNDSWNLITHSEIPLNVDVDEPNQVGLDRLLAALAAKVRLENDEQHQARSAIVVDSGTAVTIDTVNFAGSFVGGYIYPGIESSFQQLSHRTAALPDLGFALRQHRLQQPGHLGPGRNTVDAIIKGIYQSQWAAIRSMVAQLENRYPPARVFITGGGISELDLAHEHGWLDIGTSAGDAAWPNNWDFVADLVLEGISLTASQLPRKIGDS